MLVVGALAPVPTAIHYTQLTILLPIRGLVRLRRINATTTNKEDGLESLSYLDDNVDRMSISSTQFTMPTGTPSQGLKLRNGFSFVNSFEVAPSKRTLSHER